jgi:hypothetical protein
MPRLTSLTAHPPPAPFAPTTWYSLYLLYWYKSTNADVAGAGGQKMSDYPRKRWLCIYICLSRSKL